ncbi:fructosamine kinase family protein [Olivibacter ginsenosidimutans]|uniref:Fructosamine kinase family protein n=1 Tax=Olivibacter ginsenosidimutans TaxID=1176537 RepID=A0ABP9BEG9_9SPHI
MFFSAEFLNHIEAVIGNLIGTNFRLISMLPVSGGDINESFRIQGQQQSFFLKVNDADRLPHLFVLEREGLKLLQKTGGAVIPDLLVAGQYKQDAFLLMSWIEKGENTSSAQANLGRMLAFMHKNTQDFFGLDYDNYLGALRQQNTPYNNWADFFIEERLKKQLERAEASGIADIHLLRKFERLCSKIPDLFPAEAPALLHGDLWNGNYLVDDKEIPFLIDPAVYYGHREMDLALTQLFGGFDSAFYEAYQEVFPLEKEWQKRIDLCNLYPLLFHANVFGGNYIRQVEEIVDNYL